MHISAENSSPRSERNYTPTSSTVERPLTPTSQS